MKLQLTVDVSFDDDTHPAHDLRWLSDNLIDIVKYAYGEGHFTGTSGCTVKDLCAVVSHGSEDVVTYCPTKES